MRQKAIQQPFPKEWEDILAQNLPPYSNLPNELKKELQEDIQIFIMEKCFEGCGGLTLTDEMKVTIAAQACLLLLNRKDDCYPKLSSVLVYPSAYTDSSKGLFVKESTREARLGESWATGAVVLAWDSVKRGALNFKDGQNVTLHEFAHQLDQEDGIADGAPILARRSAYGSWAKVFSREFEVLQRKKKKGKPSVFRKYGATNPAEFFAVVTEAFYEKPKQLKKKHLELYEELREYYRVDPAEWV